MNYDRSEYGVPNKITGANAGGPRCLPTRAFSPARIAQFRRYAAKFGLFGNVAVAGRQLPCQ